MGLLKLLSYPPIIVVSVNGSILFSAYYSVNVTLPSLLIQNYGFSTAEVGLAYLAPGLCLVAGSLISGRVSDYHRARFLKRNAESSLIPERRLHLQIFGMMLSLSGVLMFGWFCHFRIHVATVLVSASLVSFGMTWVFITTTSYLTESFKSLPSTLVALAGLFRNPGAAVASAVVVPLGDKMGIGWYFTGMALVEVLCMASILMLMVYGKQMRMKFERK